MLIGIIIGVVIGWLIPQPTLRYRDSVEKVGLLKWVWLHIRDFAGMN